jgi:hypothetical protein
MKFLLLQGVIIVFLDFMDFLLLGIVIKFVDHPPIVKVMFYMFL